MTSLARFGRSWSGRTRYRPIRHFLIRRRSGRLLRRDLPALEDALTADAPKLASMFEVFNLLTRHERPVGIEPLASSVPLVRATPMSRGPRGPASAPKPGLAATATLVVLAVIVAACLALSTQLHPTGRSCLVATSAGLTGYRPSHALGCVPQPVAKK